MLYTQFKKLVYDRFEQFVFLWISTMTCILLLAFRIKIFDSFFYLFLGWNLLLAMIPFFITLWLKLHKRWADNLFFFAPAFALWLLFLPNAPYIFTDFIHLRLSTHASFVLDIWLIGAYAVTGLAFGIISLIDMYTLLRTKFPKKYVDAGIVIISFMSGFGIYVGRVLRWNSWNVLQDPLSLFADITTSLTQPSAWAMTIGFGLLIAITFNIFKPKHS